MKVLCVAGLARCGTSLTMQALDAGGAPCVGCYPDFEDEQVNHCIVDRAWFTAQRGKALKWLDPLQAPVPAEVPKAIVWLSRDPMQQARSHGKMVAATFSMARPTRADVRRIAQSLPRDERSCLRAWRGQPVLRMQFERILADPVGEMERLAAFAGEHLGCRLDAASMRSVVIRRDPGCMPDLSIEAELLRRAILREALA